MSGNKFIAFLLVPLLLLSCGAFRKLPPVVVNDPVIIKDTVITPAVDTTVEIPVEDDVDQVYEYVEFKGEQYKVPVHKRDFTIAVLLPFHVGYKNPQEKARSDLMLEYYQGVLCALEKVKDLGSHFRVQLFDTKNDTLVLKQILRRSGMKDVDMIIGPTDQTQVRIAAYFARKNEIPLFSPVTVIDDALVANNYLFNLSPSDQIIAEELLYFLKRQHAGKKIILVRDGGRFDKTFGEEFSKLLLKENAQTYQVVSSARAGWKDVLSSTENVVILTSEIKAEVNRIVTSLMPHDQKITLIGSDKWLEFTSMDYSFLHQLKTHFISTNLANTTTNNRVEVQEIFRSRYNGDPTVFTYMGFDQFLFACELLDAFGEHFPVFVTGKSFTYSGCRFNFVMVNDCYQNRYLQIYAFQNRELVAVKMR